MNVQIGADGAFQPSSQQNSGACVFSGGSSQSPSNPEPNEAAGIWYNLLHIKYTGNKRSFNDGGDSGAVVFDEEGTCVGLLTGRIDSQVYCLGGGLATPIHAVFDALNITLAKPYDF
jgi:hypothetical protein